MDWFCPLRFREGVIFSAKEEDQNDDEILDILM